MNNEKDIEKKIIEFIENKEKEVSIDKMDDVRTKNEIVAAIINELEKLTKNDNKKD